MLAYNMPRTLERSDSEPSALSKSHWAFLKAELAFGLVTLTSSSAIQRAPQTHTQPILSLRLISAVIISSSAHLTASNMIRASLNASSGSLSKFVLNKDSLDMYCGLVASLVTFLSSASKRAHVSHANISFWLSSAAARAAAAFSAASFKEAVVCFATTGTRASVSCLFGVCVPGVTSPLLVESGGEPASGEFPPGGEVGGVETICGGMTG